MQMMKKNSNGAMHENDIMGDYHDISGPDYFPQVTNMWHYCHLVVYV
jgi:hypothetical protein